MSIGKVDINLGSSIGSIGKPICVVILLGAPLTAQNFERVGIPYLSPYFEVVVFDCIAWLGRSESGCRQEDAKWDATVQISSALELEKALGRFRPDYALDYIGLVPITYKIQRILSQFGTRFVVQKSGNLPIPSYWSRIVCKIRARFQRSFQSENLTSEESFKHVGLKDLFLSMWRIISATFSIRICTSSPDLALLAGSSAQNFFTRRARNILWIGSQDYYLHKHAFEKLEKYQRLAVPYIVFIDDNLPFASDWALLGLKSPVTASIYYSAIRNFFDVLERDWGMAVKIAGHPSGRYDVRMVGQFGQREVLYHQTADLVAGASAVLLHGSTAVSFAILGNKPILFMTTDELLRTTYGLHIYTMSKKLGQQPLNIDRFHSAPDLISLRPDIRLYRKYVESYIRSSEALETSSWGAFISYSLNRGLSLDTVRYKEKNGNKY